MHFRWEYWHILELPEPAEDGLVWCQCIWFLYYTCCLKQASWFSLPLFLFSPTSLSLPFSPSLSLTFSYFKISIFISSLSSILSARTKTRMTLGYRTCEGCVNQPSGLCRHSWCSLGLGNSLTIGSPKEGKPGTLCLVSEKHPENTETAIKSDPRSGGWGGGLAFFWVLWLKRLKWGKLIMTSGWLTLKDLKKHSRTETEKLGALLLPISTQFRGPSGIFY